MVDKHYPTTVMMAWQPPITAIPATNSELMVLRFPKQQDLVYVSLFAMFSLCFSYNYSYIPNSYKTDENPYLIVRSWLDHCQKPNEIDGDHS